MKKRTFTLLMIMAVIAAMCFTACSKSKATLESYINDHPEVKTKIDEKLGSEDMANVKVDFSGDELIYTFDISGMENMTEELGKDEAVKEALDKGLDDQADTFTSLAQSVLDTVTKDGAEIETVKVTVKYMYGDEEITSRTFEATPAE